MRATSLLRGSHVFALLCTVLVLLSIFTAEVAAYEGDGSCFLRSISMNDSACSEKWTISFVVLVLTLLIVLALAAALGNLYRTPWNTTLNTNLDTMHIKELQIGTPDDITATPVPVAICERCGTTAHVHEFLTPSRRSTIMLCAGCVCYKLILRTFPPHLFIMPSAYLCWFFGIGDPLPLLEILCGLSLFVVFLVVLTTLLWNKPALSFIFTRRRTPDKGEGPSWQPLSRVLDPKSSDLLARCTRPKHKSAIESILFEEEEILFLEGISVWQYFKRNYDFQMLLWCFASVPVVWGAIGLFFLFGTQVNEDVIFGVWVTLFVIFLSAPYVISTILKCSVTYVLTNARALRVNTTLFGKNRVYSYPYYRMKVLYVFNYVVNDAISSEGKLSWVWEGDEDSFTCFEYAANIQEAENTIMQFKVPRELQSWEDIKDLSPSLLQARVNFFLFLQFLPLVVLVLFLVLAVLVDKEMWGSLAVLLIPCLWLTGLLHLLYRKFRFLSKCALKATGLQDGVL